MSYFVIASRTIKTASVVKQIFPCTPFKLPYSTCSFTTFRVCSAITDFTLIIISLTLALFLRYRLLV